MSEAARIRESIDLAEFERRLRDAPADQPQTAYDYSAAPVDAPPARPPFPRPAGYAEQGAPSANPVGNLRQQLEAAASRNDPFHAVVNGYPNAAERFSAAAPPPPPAAAQHYAPHMAPAQHYAPHRAPAQHYAPPTPPAEETGWRPEAFDASEDSGKGGLRKRKLLLGAAAAVLVVGVGLTVAMRGSPTGGNAPTIRASNEPFKIQPEAKPTGQKPSEAATILDRSGSERLAASRVVTREEQPVDVREAARQAAAANPPANRPGPTTGAAPAALPTNGPAANGFFPEPRRVRTVSVRPDGSIVTAAPQAAPAAAAPAPARPAAPAARPAAPAPQTSAPPAAPVRVAAATPPKTSERAAPTTTASTSAAATPATAATRAASPQSAAVAATPRGAGGGYAVQLAAPGSEAEARTAISRLQQRYGAALGGRQPTVRKATVGSRDVYRVRVVGMSQADATGLCDRLKAAGGSCFIARE